MAKKYYYNTKTGQVEAGRGFFSWFSRMGPYATREEAQHALEIAAARTAAWDEEARHESEQDK